MKPKTPISRRSNEPACMTRQELRTYVLAHHEDEQAFQVYMGILDTLPGKIFGPGDMAAFEQHLIARIAQE
ncbi:DUF6887 family protein [Candidatus Cyanaurora vandensis]|uniref:DUF6887 family protein n=1 Tax=Candidatus Cyanaurora vandensis TaxID=2714958 RepID=UPI002579C80A|nr:hypothetical protein [Candidatus Cyanaurora vandensis]